MERVIVMQFGEPREQNVIVVNYETRQVKLQTEGSFGSYWISFDRCMAQYEIDYYFIQQADSEVKRLQIKSSLTN